MLRFLSDDNALRGGRSFRLGGLRMLGLLGIAAAIATIVLPVSCRRETGDSGRQVTIGCILPMDRKTPHYADYGLPARRGIDMAVDEINRDHKFGWRNLRIDYADDGGDAEVARAAMERLTDPDHGNVPVVMGSARSDITKTLCPIAERKRVALITSISSSSELSEYCGRYFFRICPQDMYQAEMMAEWLVAEGKPRVAILYEHNEWGSSLYREFETRYEALGGTIVATVECPIGAADLTNEVKTLFAARPKAIYAITYADEGLAFLKALRKSKEQLPVYGADVWGSPSMRTEAEQLVPCAKIIVPAKFSSAAYRKFSGAYRQRYGQFPSVYAAYAYDMVYIVARALAAADGDEALRNVISRTKYYGVTGLTTFDTEGNATGKGFMHELIGLECR